MKTIQHTCLQIAVIAAALLAVCGPKDDAAAQETKKETQTPDSAKTRPGDPKSVQTSAIKTHKASCNCGQLRVTVVGPDPERISLCHCNLCQKQSGSAFLIQARFPREQVTIEGKSSVWKISAKEAQALPYKTCASQGAKFYFCPKCGSTVHYTSDADAARIGVKIGTFTDPTFPPPKISGFESYGHPWAMKAADLPILRLKLGE
jgi:hypothetical protein